jgi:hypothetical protein
MLIPLNASSKRNRLFGTARHQSLTDALPQNLAEAATSGN